MGIVDSLAKEFLPGLDQLAFIRSMNVQVIAIEINAINDVGMGFKESTVAVFFEFSICWKARTIGVVSLTVTNTSSSPKSVSLASKCFGPSA